MTTIKKRVRGVVCLGCSIMGLALAPRAQARGLARSTEVQLRSTLFQYESFSDSGVITRAPAGVGQPDTPPSTTTSSSFGLMGAAYGADLGYFVSDHVQLGAGVLLSRGGSSSHSGNYALGSSTATVLSLAPRIEYAFGGELVRPYLAGFGGYRWARDSYSGAGNSKYLAHGFLFGGAVGAHIFLSDSLSLDPELSIQRYRETGTQVETGPSETGIDAESTELDIDNTYRSTSVILSIGLSGWFGGR